jgi:hypothetical protein
MSICLGRREFIAGLGGASLLGPGVFRWTAAGRRNPT